MSLTSAERGVDVEALIDTYDPATCPARLLPWLAVVFSVDFWIETWPEAKQRDVIGRAIALHRMKGTRAGLDAFVDLADAAVVSVVTPPALFFLSDADGDAYADWLARLPEIRIYVYAQVSTEDTAGALESDPDVDPDLSGDWDHDTVGVEVSQYFGSDDPTDGAAALWCLAVQDYPTSTLKAELVDGDGVVTPLELESGNEWNARRDALPIERVYFPEVAGLDLYTDDDGFGNDASYLETGFFSDGDQRHYAAYVRRSSGGGKSGKTASPTVRGQQVVDADPVRVFLNLSDDLTLFCDADDFMDFGFFDDSSGGAALYYDSWRLVDPKVQETFGPDYSFLDADRFGIPAFNAEALIDISEKAPLDAWFLDNGPIGFAIEPDLTALWNVCDAVLVAKAKRDVILIDLDYDVRKPLNKSYSISDLKLR